MNINSWNKYLSYPLKVNTISTLGVVKCWCIYLSKIGIKESRGCESKHNMKWCAKRIELEKCQGYSVIVNLGQMSIQKSGNWDQLQEINITKENPTFHPDIWTWVWQICWGSRRDAVQATSYNHETGKASEGYERCYWNWDFRRLLQSRNQTRCYYENRHRVSNVSSVQFPAPKV